MSSSLGLIGDLDDVDLIEDVEEAFGMHFTDDECGACCTVGDLFELIQTRLPGEAIGNSCATAMCFYRLRRALRHHTPVEIRPASPIGILYRLPTSKLYRIISDECGLRPPSPTTGFWGCVALVAAAGLPIAALVKGLPWPVALLGGLIGLVAFKVAPIRLPYSVKTFGDLTRVVTSRNIGSLSAQGARLGAAEAWSAFKDILSEHTSLPKDQITPDTLILVPGKVAA